MSSSSLFLENSPIQEERTPSIQLNWAHKDGEIVVTPSDHDRFVVKVGKAIELLRQSTRNDQFSGQFDLLLKELALWLGDHKGRWSKAFLTAGESTLRFIVVREKVYFESDITDSLSDLGMKLANDPDLNLIKVATRSLPLTSDDGLQSFLDPTFTLEYNGN